MAYPGVIHYYGAQSVQNRSVQNVGPVKIGDAIYILAFSLSIFVPPGNPLNVQYNSVASILKSLDDGQTWVEIVNWAALDPNNPGNEFHSSIVGDKLYLFYPSLGGDTSSANGFPNGPGSWILDLQTGAWSVLTAATPCQYSSMSWDSWNPTTQYFFFGGDLYAAIRGTTTGNLYLIGDISDTRETWVYPFFSGGGYACFSGAPIEGVPNPEDFPPCTDIPEGATYIAVTCYFADRLGLAVYSGGSWQPQLVVPTVKEQVKDNYYALAGPENVPNNRIDFPHMVEDSTGKLHIFLSESNRTCQPGWDSTNPDHTSLYHQTYQSASVSARVLVHRDTTTPFFAPRRTNAVTWVDYDSVERVGILFQDGRFNSYNAGFSFATAPVSNTSSFAIEPVAAPGDSGATDSGALVGFTATWSYLCFSNGVDPIYIATHGWGWWPAIFPSTPWETCKAQGGIDPSIDYYQNINTWTQVFPRGLVAFWINNQADGQGAPPCFEAGAPIRPDEPYRSRIFYSIRTSSGWSTPQHLFTQQPGGVIAVNIYAYQYGPFIPIPPEPEPPEPEPPEPEPPGPPGGPSPAEARECVDVVSKHPTDVIDVDVNWAPWLNVDSIATVAAAVSSGITLGTVSKTATTTTARVSGGTAGNSYFLTFTVTTQLGLTEVRSVRVKVGAC